MVLQAVDARNRAGFDRYNAFPWLSIRLSTPSATADDRAERRGHHSGQCSTPPCSPIAYSRSQSKAAFARSI